MNAQQVILALAEQVECYRRLVKLAEIQHEHVQSGETSQLLEVLGQRQRELDRISSLEPALPGDRGRWTAWVQGQDQESRTRVESLLDETRRLLELITVSDRNDAMVLHQRKQSVGREIRQATSAVAVNRRYATAAYGSQKSSMNVQR
ncbi:MAG: hypothetical protein ABSH20_24810 [Tepidisphaeraceae bacterium]|jgi:hypothetical protein